MHTHTHTHTYIHFTFTPAATLTIRQGRIITDLDIIPVVGIATVELGGDPAGRPTYYFDCITDINNGSGLRWTKMSTENRFEFEPIPWGTPPGMRLSVGGIDYGDLDIYTCSDMYSNDVVSVNITASESIVFHTNHALYSLTHAVNPAIVAAEDTVEVVQGLTAELEVYVSGYPIPTESRMTWYRPDFTILTSSDQGVSFQDGGRRMILSNVQVSQAGLYECEVVITLSPRMDAFTMIQLNVYGEYKVNNSLTMS